MSVKKCIKCGTEKPLSDFVRRGDSFRNTCRECQNAKQRAEYANPISGRKAYSKAYYETHRDSIISRVREWQLMNMESVRRAQGKHLKKRVSIANDTYVRELLAHGTNLDPASFPEDLVSLKRLELLVKRTSKEMQK